MQTLAAMCHTVLIILMANVDVRYCSADIFFDLRGVLKFGVSSVGSMGPFWKFWKVSRLISEGLGRSETPFWEPWGVILSVLAALGLHFVSSGGLQGAMGGSSGTPTAIWHPTVEFP